MSFNKISNFKTATIETLNNPTGWDIINTSGFKKFASTNEVEIPGFDITESITKHPDHLFIKIFAIKENEPNDNGDCFSPDELKRSANTFIGVPLFSNHKNDDIENSRGECVHSWYDPNAQGIWIIGRVDKVAFPKLARAIEEGYITGTSMGCSVEYAVCSICHNLAHNADEYCVHIRESKNRKRSGMYECLFHKSKNLPNIEKCLISDCNCRPDESKMHKYDNKLVFEWNFGIRFIENSFVVNPACHTCGVSCVLHAPSVHEKIAHIKDNIKLIEKLNYKNKAIKVAGTLEIDMLKQSMNNLEKVVHSMLSQKDYVDVSYPSEVIDAMAKIQNTTDELIEAGYGQIESPAVIKESFQNLNQNNNTEKKPVVSPESAALNANKDILNQMKSSPVNSGQVNNIVPKKDRASQGNLGNGLGTITLPKQSSVKNIYKKKDFIKTSCNILKMMKKIKNTSVENKVS